MTEHELLHQRVEELLSQMSLADKAGQMTQLSLDALCEGPMYKVHQPPRLDPEKLQKALIEYRIGSVLNVAQTPFTRAEWLQVIQTIQEVATQKTPLGIPILYGIDAIHGANYTLGATLFPQQINMGASFNPELVEQAARATAFETRSSGIPWNFSPVGDVCRNVLWPRLWETFGEDPYLATRLTVAMTRGFEGTDLNDWRVASCLKHFLGYGAPVTGKDRTPAMIPERMLREYFLPPFEAAIAAGARTIMINSGEINGIPVHADPFILTTLLREELGFEGIAVTDWEDIKYLHSRHAIAPTIKEAVRLAVLAGVDMSMVPDDLSFPDYLIELVEEGAIPEARLDESVRRILKLKLELDLFEYPVLPAAPTTLTFAGEVHKDIALNLARESITLLKNKNGILPLSTDKKVLLTGPTANSLRSLNGGWSYTWQGDGADKYGKDELTFLDAVKAQIGAENVLFEQGASFTDTLNLVAVARKARQVDHIFLCLGESSYTEFIGNINDLTLSEAQLKLADLILSIGVPVTLVLLEGRPRIIRTIEAGAAAIVQAYYPGNSGGQALAEVLFGAVNPSGKLPYTYPKFPNAIHTYDHKVAEGKGVQGSQVLANWQYPFGHGLSYTTFEYSHLILPKTRLQLAADRLEFSITIKNTGERFGKETVLIFTRDEYASITPSVRRLRAFKKIALEAQQAQTLHFSIALDELGFFGIDNKKVVEPGRFFIFVGPLEATFEVVA